MKDYYRILECTPMSTRDDIKRNYRRLAQQFHPDKHADDPFATARFHDIKEAYETLTRPALKNAWLQERWLHQVMNKLPGESEPMTPYLVLKKVLQLEKHISRTDSFRMDHYGMVKKMEAMLSDEQLECLLKFNESEINRTILSHLLTAARGFPLSMLENLIQKMHKLAANDQESVKSILDFRKILISRHKTERYTLPLILLATALICALIYLSGKY